MFASDQGPGRGPPGHRKAEMPHRKTEVNPPMMAPSARHTVLVVEDDPSIAEIQAAQRDLFGDAPAPYASNDSAA
ncbi:hypothetical protein AB0D13_37780 [Streptomyces sp. NPDC048430]|uniref:hypothetical protein n=1 Tax=Streptomyces sp. NPDC048430 TaxID=3155388 RepID=UPI003448CD1A